LSPFPSIELTTWSSMRISYFFDSTPLFRYSFPPPSMSCSHLLTSARLRPDTTFCLHYPRPSHRVSFPEIPHRARISTLTFPVAWSRPIPICIPPPPQHKHVAFSRAPRAISDPLSAPGSFFFVAILFLFLSILVLIPSLLPIFLPDSDRTVIPRRPFDPLVFPPPIDETSSSPSFFPEETPSHT